MRVMVTGGAGFIGSHVVDRFVEAGHEVVVVDDLSSGRESNLNPKAKFVRLDLRDPDLARVCEAERPEIVDHHAAQIDVRKSIENPVEDAEINILGSLRLIDFAVKNKVQKFSLFISKKPLWLIPAIVSRFKLSARQKRPG